MSEQTPAPTGRPALAGIRVVELGHIVAGPFAGMIFADLGAEVIKIEHPDGGDSMRKPASIGLFYSLNWNKKSVQLDLKQEQDRAVFLELIRDSDILIENMGPGIADKLGAGYEDLSKINPGLIYCSIKGFLPGPYENRPLVDEMAQMMGGLAYMTGPPGQPMRAGASIVDMTSATFAALGVLAALHRRNETGRGDYIIGGMFETVGLWVARYLVEYQLNGQVPEPLSVASMGQRMRWEVYDRFRTRDGSQIIIACTSDKHWAAFCDALELTDWKNDERILTKEQRMEARDWLLPAIQEVVSNRDRSEIAELLYKSGVPVAPVNTPADLLTDPQLLTNGQFLQAEADGQTVQVPVLPFRSRAFDSPTSAHVPTLGEHTREIVEKYSPRPKTGEADS